MNTRPYPSYKDSGVEWLGRIPTNWQVKRLKFAAPACDVKLAEKPSGSTYVGLENIESKTGRLLLDTPVEIVDSTVVAFRRGDVLFGKLRPYLAKVVRPDFGGVATTELVVLRPHGGIDAQFLTYRLLAPDSIELINASTYGAKMPRANGKQVGNLAIAWPSSPEQQDIAAFLDRETGKIDVLVKKKERLIELLLEQRTALISHAVTHGLDPNAPKKDSGIPWLGDNPAHWEIKRLSTVCGFEQGKAHEPFVDDAGEFICVNSRFISTEGASVKFCRVNLTPAKHNDILMVMSDLPNGRALAKAYFVNDNRSYAVNQRVCRLTAHKAHPRFLFYQLNRNEYFLQHDDGANQTHLYNGLFTKFPALLPPLSEQAAIADYLDGASSRLDALMAKVRTAIERLQEYRTALISATVTGQIDVRKEAA
jgi:type I restriction enzyme S subunit